MTATSSAQSIPSTYRAMDWAVGSGLALYPSTSIAFTISSSRSSPLAGLTISFEDDNSTCAEATPLTFETAPSILTAQSAQSMPSMRKDFSPDTLLPPSTHYYLRSCLIVTSKKLGLAAACMLQADIQQGLDMVIIQRVVHHPAFFTLLDQAERTQY